MANQFKREEVINSQECRFFRRLGYTEEQAVTLAMLDLGGWGNRWKVSRDPLYREILRAFDRKRRDDRRSFPRFFCDYFFDRDRMVADGYAEPLKPAKDPRPDGGFRVYEEAIWEETVFEATVPESSPWDNQETVFDMTLPGSASEENPFESAPAFSMRRKVRESFRTDSYERIEEKGMRETAASPVSTFRTTYNTAAATILLSNIREGSRTGKSMVRTEELLNYMTCSLKKPGEAETFALTAELKAEEGTRKAMLYLGIQGKRTLPARQNICFLLDTSGSMTDRASNMVMSVMAVVSRMKEGDVFSLVTYSTNDKIVIDGLKLGPDSADEIIWMLAKEVTIDGCTNGSAGIEQAYSIIQRNMIPDGVNRVIILTDGDLNFGVTQKDGLEALILEKKKTGAYFSAIGTGIYNLQDDKLETLAKNGNGNYFVVNCLEDIERNIVLNYESLVFPIAKNVKAQVEFNPGRVARYRLIGYENRMLNREDFRNDAVIAEPFGSGSHCVALYELELSGEHPAVDAGLKYQTVVPVESDELATLTLRWESAEGDGFHEQSFPVPADLPATSNIEEAMACVELAERLRADRNDSLTLDRLARLLRS